MEESNKSILITGAAGNLGKAVIQLFLEKSWKIIAIDAPGKKAAIPSGKSLIPIEIDLMDEEKSRQGLTNLMEEHPDISVAALLVGGFGMGTLADSANEDLDKMIRLNFFSAYHVVRPLVAHFEKHKRKGRISLIGAKPLFDTEAAKATWPYSLSKSMLLHLAKVINEQGKELGYTASLIAPSIIDTAPNREAMPDMDFSSWVKPEQIAELVYFISSSKGAALREPVYKIFADA